VSRVQGTMNLLRACCKVGSLLHKFLSKCTLFLEKPTNLNGLPATNVQQGSAIRSSTDPQVDFNGDVDRKKTVFFSGDMDTGVENQRKIVSK